MRNLFFNRTFLLRLSLLSLLSGMLVSSVYAVTLNEGDGTYTFSAGDQVKLNNDLVIEPIDAGDFKVQLKVYDADLNLLGTTEAVNVSSDLILYEFDNKKFQVKFTGTGFNQGVWSTTIYLTTDIVTISEPIVSDLTSTSATIIYTVTNAILSNPTLCYGPIIQGPIVNCVSLAILDPGNPYRTKAVINGLEPDGTPYAYRLILDKDVAGKEIIDTTYSFNTAIDSSKPDLWVKDIIFTKNNSNYPTYTFGNFYITYCNKGGPDTSDGRIKYSLSYADEESIRGGPFTNTVVPAPGECIETPPTGTLNSFNLQNINSAEMVAKIDVDNIIDESNETNNDLSKTIVFEQEEDSPITISYPAVSNLTSTGVTISYTVTDAILSNPSLCYGATAQTVTTNCVALPILDPGNPFATKAVLSGLEPDMSYYYQLILDKDVTGKEFVGLIYSFETFAVTAKPDLWVKDIIFTKNNSNYPTYTFGNFYITYCNK
ncbi:MAG: hypothetical protein CMI53_05720, partial [Parcubacteria group bacterium]|nr:hypothetical protein [Parcubacteria group bacterium]